MDFRQLKALIAVADHGTFSAAADALETVQSNVSTHIARLEKELGSALIDRSLNRLTPEGEAVVRRSRRIASEMDNIGADVAAFRDEVMGEVSLGMIGTAARWLLPVLLPAVEKQFPDISLRVTTGTTTSLEPAVSHGELDISVIQLPGRNPDVAVMDLFEEDIALMLPSTHELAAKKDITFADLLGVPMLLPNAGSPARSELDATARRSGIHLVAKSEIDGVELTVFLAALGMGPALIPITAIPAEPNPAWRAVRLEGVAPRKVGIAQNRRSILSPPARAVRQLLVEVAEQECNNRLGLRLSKP